MRIKIYTRRLELDRVLKLLLKCLTSRKPISLIAISPQTDPITEIFVMEQLVIRDSNKLLLLLSKYCICQHVLPFKAMSLFYVTALAATSLGSQH